MITFKIMPDGGEPYPLTAGARDVLMWERTGHGRVFSHLVNEQRIVDMYAIAFFAARRLGLFTGDLKDFEQSCDLTMELEAAPDGAGAEGEGSDPTSPGQ